MNLKETLEKLDKDMIVAIGAKGGNGFMYIGPAGNIEMIDKLFNNYLKKVNGRQRTAIGCLSDMLAEPLEREDGDASYLDDILARANNISKRLDQYKAATAYQTQYKPVLEREVVDRYRKEVDDCRAIIVEGLEQGEFWTREEFDEKYGN